MCTVQIAGSSIDRTNNENRLSLKRQKIDTRSLRVFPPSFSLSPFFWGGGGEERESWSVSLIVDIVDQRLSRWIRRVEFDFSRLDRDRE